MLIAMFGIDSRSARGADSVASRRSRGETLEAQVSEELQRIRSALADRRVSVVAKKTGLSRYTITAIRDGHQENPKLNTIKVLSAYLAGEAA
jgi:hypothetical protein